MAVGPISLQSKEEKKIIQWLCSVKIYLFEGETFVSIYLILNAVRFMHVCLVWYVLIKVKDMLKNKDIEIVFIIAF